MTEWERGYGDGQHQARLNPRAFAIAPGGSVDWQCGWRAGFRDERAWLAGVRLEELALPPGGPLALHD